MTTGTAPAVTSISQPLPPLLVKKLVESAQAPTRGSAFAAGYDLYSAKETVVPAKGKALIDTGLAIAVPEGTCTPSRPFSPFLFFLEKVY
jgi:dUTP pyrophosphatase